MNINDRDKMNWVPLPDDPDLLYRPGYDYGAKKKIATTQQAAQPSALDLVESKINNWVDKLLGKKVRHDDLQTIAHRRRADPRRD